MSESIRYIDKPKSPYISDDELGILYPNPGTICADVRFPEFKIEEFQNEFEEWIASNRLRKQFPQRPVKPVLPITHFENKPIPPVKPKEPEHLSEPTVPSLVNKDVLMMRMCPEFNYKAFWAHVASVHGSDEVTNFIIENCPLNTIRCFLNPPFRYRTVTDYIAYVRKVSDKIYSIYRSKKRKKNYENYPGIQILDMQLDDYVQQLYRFHSSADVEAGIIVRQNMTIAHDNSKRPFLMMNDVEKLYLIPGSSYYRRLCNEICKYEEDYKAYRKYLENRNQQWDEYFKKVKEYDKEYSRYLDKYNSSIVVSNEYEETLNTYKHNLEKWYEDVRMYGPEQELTIKDYLLINYLYDDFCDETNTIIYLSDGKSYEFPEWLRGKHLDELKKTRPNWNHRDSYREFLKMNPNISKVTNDKYEVRSVSDYWNMKTFVKAWVINHFTGLYEDISIIIDK